MEKFILNSIIPQSDQINRDELGEICCSHSRYEESKNNLVLKTEINITFTGWT
jgi:hypothetical protein